MRALGVLIVVLLIAAVVIIVVMRKVIQPYLVHRHIAQLEAENARLDNLIDIDRKRVETK